MKIKFDKWRSDKNYEAGDIVEYFLGCFVAQEDISSAGLTPPINSSWEMTTPARLIVSFQKALITKG